MIPELALVAYNMMLLVIICLLLRDADSYTVMAYRWYQWARSLDCTVITHYMILLLIICE
jgi:hypothetical protein